MAASVPVSINACETKTICFGSGSFVQVSRWALIGTASALFRTTHIVICLSAILIFTIQVACIPSMQKSFRALQEEAVAFWRTTMVIIRIVTSFVSAIELIRKTLQGSVTNANMLLARCSLFTTLISVGVHAFPIFAEKLIVHRLLDITTRARHGVA
jgi:hypothetical protein